MSFNTTASTAATSAMVVAGHSGVAGLTRDVQGGVVESQREASYLSVSLSEDRMNNMVFVIIHVVK